MLSIWEAQFGDFANGAQVVIDQFISSGEHKWGKLTGLVMLLPHGFEGQGAEHSSARIERYLQLCSSHNMQVCVPSTPAQIFHLLRRQVVRDCRKPLIVITPKSLLRAKASTSLLRFIEEGEFQRVVDDRKMERKEKVQRVVLCAGAQVGARATIHPGAIIGRGARVVEDAVVGPGERFGVDALEGVE